MRSSTKLRVGAAALAILALVPGIAAALLSAYAIAKARMPYNEEGNYFDGVIVHHAGSEYFYGILSLPFWAFAIFASVGAYRTFKRAGAVQLAVQRDGPASGGPAR